MIIEDLAPSKRESKNVRRKKPYERKGKEVVCAHSRLPGATEHEMARQYVVSVRLNVEYNNLCYFMPLMNPKKMKNILVYIRDSFGTGHVDDTIYTPTASELALALAVEANCFVREGNVELARQLYDKSRKVLMPVFDDADHDVNVASAYTQLSMFLTSVGDLQRARFFYDNVELSIIQLRRANDDPETQTYIMFLEFVTNVLRAMINDDSDLLKTVTSLIQLNNLVTRVAENDEIDTGNVSMSSDILEIIEEMYQTFLKRLTSIEDILPTRSLHSQKTTFHLMALGSKLLYYKCNNIMNQMVLDIANEVTEVANTEYYAICPPFVGLAVIEAAIVQANFFKEQKDLEKQLLIDVKSLRLLGQRHVLAGKRYLPFADGIEKLLNI